MTNTSSNPKSGPRSRCSTRISCVPWTPTRSTMTFASATGNRSANTGGPAARPVGPLFYPRTAEDLYYGLIGFMRVLNLAGMTEEDIGHMSLPLGIHPAGHLMCRAGEKIGAGMVLGRRWQHTALRRTARSHPHVPANRLAWHGQLRDPARQSGKIRGIRSVRLRCRKDHMHGGTAVAVKAPETVHALERARCGIATA